MPSLDLQELPLSVPPLFYGFNDAVVEVTLHEPRGARPAVPERLVQDVWARRQFDASALVAANGAPVTVLDPGTLNTDSGPDFTGARLRVGSAEWTGDVEIHVTSSGWFDHRHHLDPAYNRVVLHVALHPDVWTGGLLRADGTPLPEVILYPHLDASLRRLLYDFYTRSDADPLCAGRWRSVPASVRAPWIDQLAAERLRAKRDRLADAYLHTPDLEALLHERLFAALGYAKNAEPMAMLARRLPLSLVRRLRDPLDREALHLGVAGLLPTPADLLRIDRASADYAMALRDRFDRLQLRHEVPVMDRTAWRFFRLRPANFPPLRIVQAAKLPGPGGLLHHDPIGRLTAALQAEDPVATLHDTLHATPEPFWDTHVRLEKPTRPRDPSLGRARRNAMIANAIAPVLLLHAEQVGWPALEAAVFDVMRALPAERDAVTRRFEGLGTKPGNAFTAQGLHQLYRSRCTEARCLSCAVGRHLLNREE